MRTTRRTFLGGAAVASLPIAAVAATTPDMTPDDRFRHHFDGLLAAMKALHPERDKPLVICTDECVNVFICMGETRMDREAKEAPLPSTGLE